MPCLSGEAMRRREFITLLGGAAVAWPLTARAQQRMRRIGALMNFAADDPGGHTRLAAFQKMFQQLGWTEGKNFKIDFRWRGASAVELDAVMGPALSERLMWLSPDR
jgi:putative ABC transport system substrate-binding protein